MSRDQMNVLMIEDNAADVHLIKRMLREVQELEIRLDAVERLSKGLALLAEEEFDVILLDLSLPDSLGMETFTRVREQEEIDIPIVVLSGLSDEEMALQAVQAGAQDYLVKGKISADSLQRSLRYAVERAQLLAREREARVLAEEAQQQLSLLAEASSLLTSSLDYETTLESVAHLVVPQLADYCAIERVMEDGSIRCLTVAHTDPEMQQLAGTLRHFPGEEEVANLLTQVLQSGKTRLIPNLSAEELKQVLSGSAGEIEPLEKFFPLSLLIVPLKARGQILGALTLARTGTERTYEASDMTLTEEVAQRAALAIDNATLYRNAQNALQRSDEARALLNTLLETAPAGFAFLDTELRFVRVNAALAQMDRLPVEAHIGERIGNALPQIAPSIEPLLRQVLEEGEPLLDLEVAVDNPAGTGQKWYWLGSLYPIRDREQQLLGIGAVLTDITGRKLQEERLRFVAETGRIVANSLDHQTTLQDLAELAVPLFADWCIIYIVEEDGTIRPAEVAHKEPEKRQVALRMARCYPLPLDDRSTSPLSQVLRARKPRVTPEINPEQIESIAQDAEHLKMLQTLNPISAMAVPLVARGRTLGALAFATSDSGRHYNEDDLNTAEEVAVRVALSIDNARLYRQAQEAVGLRDDLLAAVSHDLSSPLTSIKGQAQLLLRRATKEAEGAPNLTDGLRKINERVSHMAAMLDELLDVARIQAGQPLELNYRSTDLVTIVQTLAEECQRATDSHEVRVENAVSSLVGDWDQARLERVVDNLLSNAVKYSPSGGVITVRLNNDDAWGTLTIKDQGIGIPAADLPHIFERFRRGSNVIESMPGTGLGLAGALRIVKAHGGDMEVESEEGVGTTITLRLPTTRPENDGSSTTTDKPFSVTPPSSS